MQNLLILLCRSLTLLKLPLALKERCLIDKGEDFRQVFDLNNLGTIERSSWNLNFLGYLRSIRIRGVATSPRRNPRRVCAQLSIFASEVIHGVLGILRRRTGGSR